MGVHGSKGKIHLKNPFRVWFPNPVQTEQVDDLSEIIVVVATSLAFTFSTPGKLFLITFDFWILINGPREGSYLLT